MIFQDILKYICWGSDEALDKFVLYKEEVENQLGRKIERVRSDRGGEYLLLNDFCEKDGIIHEVTPFYSPESNGVAERKNRTLKEMMNAMLVSSSAPENLWVRLFYQLVICKIEFHIRKLAKHLMNYGKVILLT